MSDLQQETTDVLQRLVRFDTVNPPGNEREAQEWLAKLLEDAGFEVQLLGRTEPRPNLVARLRGKEDGPVLCLLSHVDTVLATPGEWQRDPWSGDVADGFLWGRGALDMKSQTAAEVVAAIALAREGWRPARGDLLVVVVVDEETGGAEGAQWICEHHPDAVRCDYLLNEGGGTVIPFEGGRLHGVCVAEKGVFRFKLRTSGVAGHASIPKIGDNALLKMAPLLQAMGDRQPSFDVTDGPRAMLEGLGIPVDGDASGALEALRARDAFLAMLVEPMLGVTLAPTRIRASEKINVIPSQAEIGVDCRVPPGLGEEDALKRIHEVLGGEGYEIEFSEKVIGNASPVESPLMDAIRGWLEREDPETRVVPTILPGFTDSRTFRAAFPDLVAYGFFPHLHMTLYETAPLIHSADERIDVRDLGVAARFFRDVSRELLGVSDDKLRLGGMALRNGLLVHGPNHWAAAVRRPDGAIGVASGPKPRAKGRLTTVPGARGVLRLGEALAVIPLVKRALPEARLPFQDATVLGSMAAATIGGAVLRRRTRGAGGEVAVAALSVLPSIVALRGGDLAAYHGVEHKAIAAYEQDSDDARDAAKEHDRCGSHLMAPMLASNLAGVALLRRAVERPSPMAGGAVALASVGVAVEVFAWSERHDGTRAARMLRRPGTELQRVVGTREPTEEQLEVGRAALQEILRVES